MIQKKIYAFISMEAKSENIFENVLMLFVNAFP